MTTKAKAGRVSARPAPPRTPVVGIDTPVYGCNSEAGKIAQGIAEAFAAEGVNFGVLGYPDVRGYSAPPPAPESPNTILSLALPFAWKYAPPTKLVGIVHATYSKALASWDDPFRFADSVFVPSAWAREVAGVDRARIFRFGVDRSFSYEPKQRSEMFRVLFVAEDASDPRKGLDLAVSAFQKAFYGRDDVEMVVRSINRDIDKDDFRIRFAFGNKTPGEMAKLYRSADVVVCSSRAEAFGMDALEAIACGTPAIHSGKTGFAELGSLGLPTLSRPVPAQDGGEWFEPYADEIAAQLQSIAANRDALDGKAKSDAAAVDAKFRWSLGPLLS